MKRTKNDMSVREGIPKSSLHEIHPLPIATPSNLIVRTAKQCLTMVDTKE